MDKKKIALLIMLGVVSTPSTLYASGRNVVKVPSYLHCTHEKMIGKDRYETGVLTTKKSKRLNNIIVVNGKEEKLVDGLCASILIDKLDATVLPINPNKVNTDAKKIIDNAKNVYIIGENEAIPYSFEESINKKVKVTRIGGKDRFETSKEIAKYLGSYDKAFLVNGVIGQADAMSMSSVSAKYKIPILLTKENSSIFDKKENIDYTVIGGTDVISNKLQNNFEAKRIGGKTRYETNKYVLNTYYPKSTIRYFTNGETLVDALSGASLSKNDGITFISRQKNHDLLEYIDTVQVGGLPYDVEFIVSDTNNNVGGGTIVKNNPPTKPEIEAKVTEKENAEGEYFVEINMTKESTDPDGDKVSYEYKGRSEDDYYSIGTHTVKVRAIDSKKATSDWFEISFTIEKKEEIKTLIKGETFNLTLKRMSGFENVREIRFVQEKPNPDGIDVSEAKDGSIKAHIEGIVLTVASEDEIFANPNSKSMFEDFGISYGSNTVLNKITFNNFNTSQVTNMDSMFLDCYLLQSLDVSNWNISNVTDMSRMFNSCKNLVSLNLNNWDTSNVTDISLMFAGCSSLTSLDLNKFNISNVKHIDSMFVGCSSLTSLDLSSFNKSNAKNISSIFRGCSSLQNLSLSNWDTSNVENMGLMFAGCSSLQNLDLSNLDTSNVENMDSMFAGCSSLQNLNLSNWDTSNVINTKSMFNECKSLTSLDLSNLNTSKLIYMKEMFRDCSSLTSLDLSNFDTSKVTNMSDMFKGCSNLLNLYINNFNTSKVLYMGEMFYNCSSLTSLDLSNWDTSQVTDMSGLFNGCSALTSLDLSNWDTSNATYMYYMFIECYNLSEIKGLDNFNISNVKNVDFMFNSCSKLSGEITIPTPDISLYDNMFRGCSTDLSAKFIINYKFGCKDVAQKIVNQKYPDSSNIVLGVEK